METVISTEDRRSQLIQKRGYSPSIRGDEISLYISNYREAAEYLAGRIGDPTKAVVELCCGIGVTLQELARVFSHAYGVEQDATIFGWCQDNISHAQLAHKVELLAGDVSNRNFLQALTADVAIYDIPYWDMGISKEKYSSRNNPSLYDEVQMIRELITQDIVVFAPAGYTYAMAIKELGICEFQEIYRHSGHKRTYIYLGNLIKEPGITRFTF